MVLSGFVCCFTGQSEKKPGQHTPAPATSVKTCATSIQAVPLDVAARSEATPLAKESSRAAVQCRHHQSPPQQPTPAPAPALAPPSAPPQWAYVFSTLADDVREGPWLQRLWSSAEVLLHLVPGGMVSISAVMGCTHLPLVVTGRGSETLAADLGVPHTMVGQQVGEEMGSVGQMMAAAGVGPDEDWDRTLTPSTLVYLGSITPLPTMSSPTAVQLAMTSQTDSPSSSTVAAAAAASAAGCSSARGEPNINMHTARGFTSHTMQHLPPDWQALAAQHGLRSFMCIPLTKARRLAGVLTLACPEAWSSSPLAQLNDERQASLAMLMAQPLQANEPWVACSLLQSLGMCCDIDQLVRALCTAAARLCASAYFQAPTCRAALFCQDAPAAVVFELSGATSANLGSTNSLLGSAVNSGASGIPPTPAPTPAATAGGGGLATNTGALLTASSHSSTHSNHHNHTGSSSVVASHGSHGPGPGLPSRHASARAMQLPLSPSQEALSLNGPGSGGMGTGAVLGLGLGLGLGQAGSGALSPGLGLRPASSQSFTGGGRQAMALGHALHLRQTLLGAAVEAQGGVAWLPDCTSYVQEGHACLRDQVISKANRTVGSLVVAVGRPRPGAQPLLAAYCTFRTPQPDGMLESLGGKLQELMQVAAPLVWRKLQRDMAAEWQLLHQQLAERLHVGGSHSSRPRPRKAATQPAIMVGGAEHAGSPLCPDRGLHRPPQPQVNPRRRSDAYLMNPASPLLIREALHGSRREEDSSGHGSNRGSNVESVTHPGSNCDSGTRTGSNGGDATRTGSNGEDTTNRQGSNCESITHPGSNCESISRSVCGSRRASFVIERAAKAGHSTADHMAPIMAGVHDKLMQMQMSRLLYGSAQDHQEELEAIVVLRKIGQGGSGTVYHGKFHGLDVAIKIMKQDGGGGDNRAGDLPGAALTGSTRGGKTQAVEMLSKATEVAVMFSVSHPNIVQVMTFFTDVVVREEPLHDGSGHALVLLEAPPPERPVSTVLLIMSPKAPAESDRASAEEGGHQGDDSSLTSTMESIRPSRPTPGPQRLGTSIVVCMELCDMGTLWGAVCKGTFRHLPPTTAGCSTKRTSAELMLLPPKLAAIYHTLLEVALALAHLHSLSLVHCDVKAANVLLKSNKLDPRGFTCKLSDFGLARLMVEDEEGNVAIPNDIDSGTLTHMAPEIFLRGSRLTSSVDIYAFGIMMYEVMVGQLAYKGLPVGEATQAVVKRDLRPHFPDYVPQDYRELAQACWDSDPAQRPDASLLVNVLEAMLYTVQSDNK